LEKLLAGGKAQQCGWLTDKFGVTWQIVPDALLEMIGSEDTGRVARMTEAMMKMIKLDIAGLKKAYRGKGDS
jgi:predicted 3-demethylubiquinone-9 3-methyltransferase (glyoxalase superfamily)